MANGTQSAPRKGLHPLAWVAIGCGGLLVVAAVVVVVAGFLVASKVKDVAEDFEANPAMATARTIVKLNPELEEVESDEEAGTITVRHTKTGEVVTVNFEDLEDGKISFTSDEGEVTIETDEGGGELHVTGAQGEKTFSLTAGEKWSGELPEWVPMYPGAESSGGYALEQGGGSGGGVQLKTDAEVQEVLDFYQRELKELGFSIKVNTYSADDGAKSGVVMGGHEESGRTIQAVVARAAEVTSVTVTFNTGK